MRVILIIFIFGILGLVANGQSAKKTLSIADPAFSNYFGTAKSPVVHIIIKNATKEEIAALDISYELVTPFSKTISSKTAHIDRTGNYDLKLVYPFPYQQMWISIGRYFGGTIFINEDLIIELDFSVIHKKSNRAFVKYAGADSSLNVWMNNVIAFKEKGWYDTAGQMDKLSYDDPDYYRHIDSLHNLQKKMEDGFLLKHPSVYSWILANERLSNYYENMLRYGLMKRIDLQRWQEIKAHKVLLVSNTAMLFNARLYQYSSYFKANIDYNKYRAEDESAKLDSMFDHSYADLLKLQIYNGDVRKNKQILEELIPVISTPWCKTVLKEQYETAVTHLNDVNKVLNNEKIDTADTLFSKHWTELPFGARLLSVSGISVKDFLYKLRASYKNKALILDFWATWCGPCIAEMPSSTKLHKEAAGLPVEFVYICTSQGSDEDQWKNKIAELQVPGIHLYIDAKLANELMVFFKKHGYPSYVCIDQQGQIKADLINWMNTTKLEDIKKLIN